MRVRYSKTRPRCLACGTVTASRRGFVLCAENIPLGPICLKCLVNGPQTTAIVMKDYAGWLAGLACLVERLSGEDWSPAAVLCQRRANISAPRVYGL